MPRGEVNTRHHARKKDDPRRIDPPAVQPLHARRDRLAQLVGGTV
jgi:hypothetical protein